MKPTEAVPPRSHHLEVPPVSGIPTTSVKSAPATTLPPTPTSEAADKPQRALRPEPNKPQAIGTTDGLITQVCLAATDGASIAAAGFLGYLAASSLAGDAATFGLMPRVLLLSSILQFLGIRFTGLQRAWGYSPMASLARSVRVCVGTTSVIVTVLVALNQPWHSIATVLFSGACSAALLPASRSLIVFLLGRADWWGRRVVVIGSDEQAVALFTKLLRQPQKGLRPIGFVNDLETLSTDLDPTLYLGPPEALPELTQEYGVTAAVVVDTLSASQTQRLVCRENVGIRDWILMSSLDGYPSLWGDAAEVAGTPALIVRNRLLSPWSRELKRAADLVITLISFPLVVPLLTAIIVLVRCSSPGPIFYGQERVGRHGRRFKAWKFRTMVMNADEVLAEYLASDPLLRAEWEANHKLKDDPRITWIGKFLRKTSLDELPQLANVIFGEMSLVGPRPIVEAEIDKYADEYEYYVDVLPGITGLWQVSGRNNTTYEERVAFDAYYVKNWSLWLDFYILVSTVRVILFREGAY